MVIWILGLSGSGKTTLGKILCKKLRKKGLFMLMEMQLERYTMINLDIQLRTDLKMLNEHLN